MTSSARSSLMVIARARKTGSSLAAYFSMIALTDSASIRACAGSYTPQGRSQCAEATCLGRSSRASIRKSFLDAESAWSDYRPYSGPNACGGGGCAHESACRGGVDAARSAARRLAFVRRGAAVRARRPRRRTASRRPGEADRQAGRMAGGRGMVAGERQPAGLRAPRQLGLRRGAATSWAGWCCVTGRSCGGRGRRPRWPGWRSGPSSSAASGWKRCRGRPCGTARLLAAAEPVDAQLGRRPRPGPSRRPRRLVGPSAPSARCRCQRCPSWPESCGRTGWRTSSALSRATTACSSPVPSKTAASSSRSLMSSGGGCGSLTNRTAHSA